jgi:hypothetical protein
VLKEIAGPQGNLEELAQARREAEPQGVSALRTTRNALTQAQLDAQRATQTKAGQKIRFILLLVIGAALATLAFWALWPKSPPGPFAISL